MLYVFFVSNSCFCISLFFLTYVLDGEHQTFFGTLPRNLGFHFFQLDLRVFFNGVVSTTTLDRFPPPKMGQISKADQRFRRRVHE